MSKLIDQLRQAEEKRRERESSDKARASPQQDIEAAIEEVAELRNRVESERSAETALQALGAEERRAINLARERQAAEAELRRIAHARADAEAKAARVSAERHQAEARALAEARARGEAERKAAGLAE